MALATVSATRRAIHASFTALCAIMHQSNRHATLRAAFCLTLAASLSLACKPAVSGEEHHRRCHIKDWAWYLAGVDASNCGAAGNPKTAEGMAAQVQCAEAHLAKREPFYLYNWQQGIDSYVALGWLQTPSGLRYELSYDSSVGGFVVGDAEIWFRHCGNLAPADQPKDGRVLVCREPSASTCACGPNNAEERCPVDGRSVPR